MEITEVRIKLMENAEDRLRAFCSITFDNCFVVRDLKIIEGNTGPFVAMPSRKLTAHCRVCNAKNHFRARFCNNCGNRLSSERVDTDEQGRSKLYADIAHPVNAECRERIQNCVIGEFFEELERAKQPGYASRYDDDYVDSSSSRTHSGKYDEVRVEQPSASLRGPHSPPEETATRESGKSQKLRHDFGSGIF